MTAFTKENNITTAFSDIVDAVTTFIKTGLDPFKWVTEDSLFNWVTEDGLYNWATENSLTDYSLESDGSTSFTDETDMTTTFTKEIDA